MALWIIAIILAVVFAPILLGTAATLLMVAIPIVLLVFGLVIFVSLFQQAAAAVTNPAKCRSYGAAAMAVYVLLLLPPVSNWFFKTNNNWLYQPLLLAGPYALCLMMLSKNRGRGGKKGTGGFVLWILGSLCICAAGLGAQSSWVWGSILYVFYTCGGGRNKPCRAGAADDRPRPRRDLTQGEERRRPDCRRTYDKVRVGPFGESVQRITPHRRRSGQGQDLGPDQARVLEPRQARVLGHSQHGCFLRNPAAVPCGYGPVCPLSFLEGESGGGREAEEIK